MTPFNSIADISRGAASARCHWLVAFRNRAFSADHSSSVTDVRFQLAVQSAVLHGFCSPALQRFNSSRP